MHWLAKAGMAALRYVTGTHRRSLRISSVQSLILWGSWCMQAAGGVALADGPANLGKTVSTAHLAASQLDVPPSATSKRSAGMKVGSAATSSL